MWSLCFGLLAVLIVVGNAITIWIFIKQKPRKRAHFLLISLAVADLLVGLLTVPLYIVVNLDTSARWPFLYADICSSLTSVFTLAVISLERMYAIGWPFRHRTLRLRSYKFAIVTPWILAATVTAIRVLRDISHTRHTGPIIVTAVSPTTPLLVICSAYCVLVEGKETDGQSESADRKRNKIDKDYVSDYRGFFVDLAPIPSLKFTDLFSVH